MTARREISETYHVAGVDLGGTKIYTAVADNNGNLLAEVKVPTHPEEGFRRLIERMAGTVLEAQRQAGVKEICAVGVGSPGQLDLGKGLVCASGNLGWDNVPLREMLAEELALPVVLDNDANAAALGEYCFGAGCGHRNMVYITVSTGIGSGIISEGRILHGAKGSAGEIGHLTVAPGGLLCNCGKLGCLETLASGTAIAREARRLIRAGGGKAIVEQVRLRNGRIAATTDDLGAGAERCGDACLATAEDIGAAATGCDAGFAATEDVGSGTGRCGDASLATAEDVGAAATRGDAEAMEILHRAATSLGLGISVVVNLFNPSLVILGGGVMSMGRLMWGDILQAVDEYTLKTNLAAVQVVPAGLGERSGVMGAVALALGVVKDRNGG